MESTEWRARSGEQGLKSKEAVRRAKRKVVVGERVVGREVGARLYAGDQELIFRRTRIERKYISWVLVDLIYR